MFSGRGLFTRLVFCAPKSAAVSGRLNFKDQVLTPVPKGIAGNGTPSNLDSQDFAAASKTCFLNGSVKNPRVSYE